MTESPEDYIKKMRMLNEWGDHIEIMAAMMHLNLNFDVYFRPNLTAPIHSFRKENASSTIRLVYTPFNHYDALFYC